MRKTRFKAPIDIEAVFGAWLLYWLNTKQVAQFFRRGGTVVAG
jgi:hypothetical protein